MTIARNAALWLSIIAGDVPLASGVGNLLLEDDSNILLEPTGTAGGFLLTE